MTIELPHPVRVTTAGRLWVYIQRMWPLEIRIPANLAHFLAIYLGLQAMAGEASLRLGWTALVAALTVQLLMLLIRAYDELKDADADRAFAQQGDPRFVNRPMVTGEVRREDIVFLRWVVTAAVVAINLPLGFPALLVFGFAFLYIWLSFKWFFWPPMKNNLLVAFATHMPNVLVVELYVVGAFAGEFGSQALGAGSALLVACVFAQFAAWETSSKLRAPEAESGYATYSRVLGPRWAAALPASFLALSASGFLWVAARTELGWPYSLAVAAAAGVAIARALAFALSPSVPRSVVRPYVEVFLFTASVGLVVALLVRYPLVIG